MDVLAVITEFLSDATKASVTLLVKGLFGEQIEDLATVSKRGLKNLGNALQEIYERLKEKNVNPEEVDEIDPEVLQPILEGIYIGHKRILREKWINLLQSAILGNSIHPRYTETLKLLDALDARILEIIDERRKLGKFNLKDLQEGLKKRNIEDVKDDMIIDSIFNLVEINLCYVTTLQGKPTRQDIENFSNVYVSDFGIRFLQVVNGEN